MTHPSTEHFDRARTGEVMDGIVGKLIPLTNSVFSIQEHECIVHIEYDIVINPTDRVVCALAMMYNSKVLLGIFT